MRVNVNPGAATSKRGKSSGPFSGGVRKPRSSPPAPSPRADVDALEGMLCLAAATQQANTARPAALRASFEPMRQESVSSDNDDSEMQYVGAQRRSRDEQPESEEDKKEKRRLANREAARRMRRRRATHMQAVEEEVERLSNENSLLLHRMSQLVASHQQVDAENQQLRHELHALRQSVGACLQVGQLDLANASLASAAAGGAISPSMLAAQGKQMALAPPEMPALGPSMAQRRLMIEQMHRAGGPSTSGGQSTEEMTATEEERLKHTPPPAPLDAAAHSFGDSGDAAPSTGGGSGGGCTRTVRKRGSWRPLSPA